MRLSVETNQILKCAGEAIGENLLLLQESKRGNRNMILTVNDGKDDLIIKAGLDVENDYLVLKMLNDIGFPSPELKSYSHLNIDDINYGLVVMSKLSGIQARELPLEERYYAVSVLIDEIQELRNCKSTMGAGEVRMVKAGNGLIWRDYLSNVISETERDLDTPSTMRTAIVGWNPIVRAIEIVRTNILCIPSDLELNLLHNDLNLANCIVTATGGSLVGVVDWSDAIFGDQLYDFARLRMNLEQSRDERSLEIYSLKVRMIPEECRREQLYYLCRLIEYLGIYRKYGDDHWYSRCHELLVEAIEEY